MVLHIIKFRMNTCTYSKSYSTVPVSMYAIDGISISKPNLKRLDITQGNLVKQSMGLSKRSHTTELINRSHEIVNHNLISLYHISMALL